MSTVSENIAKWVKATNYSDIPQEVVNVAKRSILDFIGVALAGSTQPAAQIVKKYLSEVKGVEESTAIGLGIKTSCVEAAFANGISGHCLDYDDFLRPVVGAGGPHITAVVLPAALALAERGNKTGEELITAYILGCEITYRVGRGMEPSHYNSGFHNTATEGVFGAVVAASKLLGLNCEEITYALGIAGSEASGLHENFGTMTKPFHAGQAAAKGVRASLLAKLGFNSSKSIFEGERGFCNVLAKNPRIDEITKNMGQPFCLPQICLKPYPCCGGTHAPIYATLELAKQYDIGAEDIEHVEVKCDPQVVKVLPFEKPKTSLEGKFSIQFCVALALSEKRVTLQEFTDEKVREPKIVTLMQKVKVIPESELSQTIASARSAKVGIKLKDGRQLVRRCDFCPGTPQNPLSEEELLEKYRSCARLALPEKEIEGSIEVIMNLERIDNIGKLLTTK
ncbi:MAG: MmgE/PrpD family protein [Dehalococcoidia bacterium]|nr:MmgE/PrpD family protein [Dehalococcoidia bacterium]